MRLREEADSKVSVESRYAALAMGSLEKRAAAIAAREVREAPAAARAITTANQAPEVESSGRAVSTASLTERFASLAMKGLPSASHERHAAAAPSSASQLHGPNTTNPRGGKSLQVPSLAPPARPISTNGTHV
jgi:hypothetical protein